MKKTIRIALLVAYVGGLAVGLLISGLGVRSVVENFATDSTMKAFSRIATTSTIATISIAYAAILLRKGFTPSAPLLYVLSFGGAGIFVELTGLTMSMGYAPSVGTSFDYVVSTAWIVAAWLAALWGIIWTYRQSRFPVV